MNSLGYKVALSNFMVNNKSDKLPIHINWKWKHNFRHREATISAPIIYIQI